MVTGSTKSIAVNTDGYHSDRWGEEAAEFRNGIEVTQSVNRKAINFSESSLTIQRL
jgi:hypothetical protein